MKLMVTIEEIEKALTGSIEHSWIGSRVLAEGADALFFAFAWKRDYKEFIVVKPSDFWRRDAIYVSREYDEVLIRSKRAFKYPYVAFRGKLPSLTVDGTKIDFGLENDSMYTIGTVQFQYIRSNGKNNLWYYTASQRNIVSFNIDYLKPSDAERVEHTYAIKVNKGFTEFFIDGSLVGVALNGVPLTGDQRIYGPPYAIIGSEAPVSQFLVVQIEVYPKRSADIELFLGMHGVFAVDGDPTPPRKYDLYLWGSSTKLRGYSVGSGSVTTHPIPVHGYRDKSIYFMTDKDGTLSIEVLTLGGNWREYDIVNVTANKLLVYKLTGDVALLRLVYTPISYPASILESEVVLGGY